MSPRMYSFLAPLATLSCVAQACPVAQSVPCDWQYDGSESVWTIDERMSSEQVGTVVRALEHVSCATGGAYAMRGEVGPVVTWAPYTIALASADDVADIGIPGLTGYARGNAVVLVEVTSAVVLHELGHVIGLEHSEDRCDVMHITAPVACYDTGGAVVVGTC